MLAKVKEFVWGDDEFKLGMTPGNNITSRDVYDAHLSDVAARVLMLQYGEVIKLPIVGYAGQYEDAFDATLLQHAEICNFSARTPGTPLTE